MASPRIRDHPRSRGVYLGDHVPGRHPEGSSPLARGLLLCGVLILDKVGIIPARAGFTRKPTPRSWLCADHPRSRGVYAADVMACLREEGSSPLARGLPGAVDSDCSAMGIIPARAGFTSTPPPTPSCRTDHPRSRGVYLREYWQCFLRVGSSPLARGLPLSIIGSHEKSRIIPARAGFTGSGGRPGHRRWDHPRSRGVYTSGMMVALDSAGSSPLARGLRLGAPHRRGRSRIIPARAGFTPSTYR